MNDDDAPRLVPCLSAEALAGNDEPAYVIAVINRDEIESGRYGRALAHLQVLSESPANVALYRESLVVMFDGFDTDGRVLGEIPEVRRYMQALVKEWPFFPWFLARGQGLIGLLLTLLCEVRFERGQNGAVTTAFSDPEEVSATLSDLFRRSNPLLVGYDVTIEALDASARSVIEDLWPE